MLKMQEDGKCVIDGRSYQAPGFGTYPLTGDICLTATKEAFSVGYRIFDTATVYANFIPLGQALKSERRSDIYLISKVWHDAQAPSKLQEDLQKTLKELQTDYLDAYLLHWPNSEVLINETMEAMEIFKKQGLIHHIGVSNVTVSHLIRLSNLGFHPSWVQVEMNPYFCDFELLNYCQSNNIGIQAWAPLGRGRIKDDQFLANMGKKYSKTASQVALRWITQHNCLALPGSKNSKHMQENLSIHDFILTNEDVKKIDERARVGMRERFTKDSVLGFADEFDYSVEDCWPNLANTYKF